MSDKNFNPTLKGFIAKYRKMPFDDREYLKELLEHPLYFDWDKIPLPVQTMINRGILKMELLSDYWTAQIEINVD